ncbi:MAG: hypothetical protein KBC33_03665 [Candidatus Pacebacteria bacterium]|nr:hypothetical protein [Candidatus Paceibacterota bacterium]
MKNELAPCTHSVPPNKFGIFAMHCKDNQPMDAESLRRIIDGPIAAMEPELQRELAKPLVLED